MLKTVKKFTNKEIKFGCTSAISLFVAVAQEPKTDVWSPFGADQKFINTNDVMSVLKVNPNAKSHRIGTSDSRNAIIAEESIKYQIFRKQQGSGEAVIPVDHKGQGVDMIIFFKGDPTVKEPPSCGGNEEIISGPKNKHLVSVSESNKISGEGWGAKQGFANQPTEPEGTANTWSVEKGGLGAFIEASFDIEYRVTKFEVFQRLKEEDRISKIKICFGQMCENAESFVLKNTPGSQVFTLDEPQQTKKVRLQIEGVFGQGKAGGKFNIYGVGCVSNDDSSLSQNTPGGSGNNKAGSFDPKKVQDLECQDSIKSNDDLMAAQFKVGDKFKVKCANACGSKKNIPIYGTNIYSSDSSICKAAVHSGVVPNQDNQKFDVTIVACPTEFESKNTDADPIQSLSKAGCSGDDFAIQFLPGDLDELAVKAIKVGRLVDVEYNGKWVPGVVQIVDVVSPRQVYCTVTINGDVPKQVKVVWPSNNIAYCGDKLSSRVCDDASKNPNAGPDAVRISFGRDPIEGWIHENGGVFGERNGQEYGWEKDATAAARSRTANGNSLLDNLILFAPDKLSQWCNGEIEGTVSCEENRWRVKVEPGTYKVKITFGDSEISARHDLIVNDKPVFGGFLKEDQFETWDDEELDCLSGEILISSACPNEAGKQCKYSWSRISAIEFSKVVRAEASQEQKPPETIDTGCGEAVKGGRCQASEDVENCLFTDLQAKGVEFCTGAFKIYHIPQHYICVDQRGSFKCTRHTFKDKDECNVKCVGSCAKKGREYECLAHNSQKKHHHLNS